MIHCCDRCAEARGYTMRSCEGEGVACLHCGRPCGTLYSRCGPWRWSDAGCLLALLSGVGLATWLGSQLLSLLVLWLRG